jgi:hypothetical protein
LHVRAEHLFVKLVAQIIVALRNPFRTILILHVEQAGLERVQKEILIVYGFVEFGRINLKKELVQSIGIPPAIHVGLSESKRTLSKDALIESVIMDQDIPGLRPAKVHVGPPE